MTAQTYILHFLLLLCYYIAMLSNDLDIRGVIFDLDGTLLNTLSDLHAAVNYALKRLDLPQRTLSEIRGMIGNGASKLVMRALPDWAKDLHGAAMELFSGYYTAHTCDKTQPYEGITELIAKLQNKCRLGVLSNKPHDAANEIVRTYFGDAFDPIFGGRSGVPLKPDPTGAIEIARNWGLPNCKIAVVGDSMPDIAVAKAAGMLPIAVAWGYGDKEAITSECELICDSAKILEDTLLKITAAQV